MKMSIKLILAVAVTVCAVQYADGQDYSTLIDKLFSLSSTLQSASSGVSSAILGVTIAYLNPSSLTPTDLSKTLSSFSSFATEMSSNIVSNFIPTLNELATQFPQYKANIDPLVLCLSNSVPNLNSISSNLAALSTSVLNLSQSQLSALVTPCTKPLLAKALVTLNALSSAFSAGTNAVDSIRYSLNLNSAPNQTQINALSSAVNEFCDSTQKIIDTANFANCL